MEQMMRVYWFIASMVITSAVAVRVDLSLAQYRKSVPRETPMEEVLICLPSQTDKYAKDCHRRLVPAEGQSWATTKPRS